MRYDIKFALILIASFALLSLALDALVAIAWGTIRRGRRWASADLLALRLLPASGAGLFTVTAVLPAYVLYEPARQNEPLGAGLLALCAFAVLLVAAGIGRAWHASAAARRLIRSCAAQRNTLATDARVDIVDLDDPLVAVIGAWRPRILAARRVLDACGEDEFRGVVDHEAAHVATADNLKLLLQVASPDLLAFLPLGTAMIDRWRSAAEHEADERAAGSDPAKRVALASALIKVARLLGPRSSPVPAFGMEIAGEQVEERVRRLLAPPSAPPARRLLRAIVVCVLALSLIAIPAYSAVHGWIEALVALRF